MILFQLNFYNINKKVVNDSVNDLMVNQLIINQEAPCSVSGIQHGHFVSGLDLAQHPASLISSYLMRNSGYDC